MRRIIKIVLRVISFPFQCVGWILSLPYRGIVKFFHFMNTEPEDHPIGDVLTQTAQKPSGVMMHLEALRRHLLRMLIGLAISIGLCFAFAEEMVDILSLPIGGIDKLVAIDVTESVSVFMRVSLLAGITLASPYLAFELWLFAAPGLGKRGRWMGLLGIPLVSVFLLAGMAFAYYMLFPAALPFLLTFMGIETIPRPSSYINFVTGLMFWIGVAFEFPLVIYVLTTMGIVKPRGLLNQWRIAVVLIAILSAMITPTVDPVNMALVMSPMILLYFISVGLSALASIGRKRKAASPES